ncbi:hypothetical protein VitviT2T_020894 [Vitis vinifera]|uniref:Uncharacterized protein n=2 Tax=Vitis vinifera TaxID=29760 RepID=A0ABY9D599_VITVI|nr:hypothetical protein VitviT2T_020894 [Vitis vinifera]
MASATTLKLIPLAAIAILISLILIQSSTPAISSIDIRTAYEVLEDYNFPVGLLPKGITDYDLNITTGKFSVYFNDTCSYSLKSSYHLKYLPTIKGYISNGKLSSLEGVYTKLFLVWKEIVEIVRDGDNLVFSVGVLSSVFPIDYFEESPQCGCGFQCGGEQPLSRSYKRTSCPTSGFNNLPIDREEMRSAASATTHRLPLAAILISLILIHSTPAISSIDSRTAYEVLEDYNFPVGLLPQGITGYDLNITTGQFSVYFNDTCSFSLESSYHLKYKPTIKGYISNGNLSSMEGVYARLFFVWKKIVEIVRSGDDLVFSVGVLSSVFPIDYFEKSPQCGCGFQCGGGQVRKLRTNPFVFPYEWS